MPSDVEVIGLERLDEVGARLAQGSDPQILVDAMGKILNNLWDAVATYPPATEANAPGRYSLTTHRPMGYYERGRGEWYPVTQRKTLGAVLTKARGAIKEKKSFQKVTGIVGYKLSGGGLSEALGRKWLMHIANSISGIEGTLMNSASYARQVQGNQQSAVMAKYGWKTIGQVAQEQAPDIAIMLQGAIYDYLKG